jgi:hypothetical protein
MKRQSFATFATTALMLICAYHSSAAAAISSPDEDEIGVRVVFNRGIDGGANANCNFHERHTIQQLILSSVSSSTASRLRRSRRQAQLLCSELCNKFDQNCFVAHPQCEGWSQDDISVTASKARTSDDESLPSYRMESEFNFVQHERELCSARKRIVRQSLTQSVRSAALSTQCSTLIKQAVSVECVLVEPN